MPAVGQGNKLSRKRLRIPDLNASAEEFHDVARPSRKRSSQEMPDPPDEVSTSDPSSSMGQTTRSSLSDCPLCGRSFKMGQLALRQSHLKSCGIKSGLGAEKLLQLKRLEDKHALERVALGLVSGSPRDISAESQTGRANSSRKSGSVSKTPQAPISTDPHLEMALALSASLAQAEVDKTEAEERQLQSLGVTEHDVPRSERPPDVLMAKAALVKAERATGRKKASRAKTCLEVRLPTDRLNQISERVSAILAGSELPTKLPVTSELWTSRPFAFSNVRSELLGDRLVTQDQRWIRSSRTNARYYNTVLDSYMKPEDIVEDQKLRRATAASDATPADRVAVQIEAVMTNEHVQSLGNDFAELLSSGRLSDLGIFCRDEREIKCHEIILRARCPRLLDDVVIEESNGRSSKVLSWPDVPEEAARIFLQYVYSAQLPPLIEKQSVLTSLQELSRLSGMAALADLLSTLNPSHMMTETEEEEWDKIEAGPGMDHSFLGYADHTESFNIFGDSVDVEHLVKCNPVKDPGPNKVDESKVSTHWQSRTEKSNLSIIPCQSTLLGGANQTNNYLETSVIDHVDLQESMKQSSIGVYMKEKDPSGLKSPDELSGDKSGFASDEDLFACEDERKYFGTAKDGSSSQPVVISSPPSNSQDNHPGLDGDSNPGVLTQTSEGSVILSDEDIWDGFEVDGGDIPSPSQCASPIHPLSSSPQRSRRPPPKTLLSTPISKFNGRITPVVTPVPEYERMLSPALRRELNKYGLKAIPRQKAVQILTHIYEETHPEIDDGEENENNDTSLSQESTMSSTKSDVPEESMFASQPVEELEDGPESSSTQILTDTNDLQRLVLNHIESTPALYKQVLLYEPLWLESFFEQLKEARPELKKFKLPQLTNIFDSECITFRTASQARSNRRENKRKSPKKKKSPKVAAAPAKSKPQKVKNATG